MSLETCRNTLPTPKQKHGERFVDVTEKSLGKCKNKEQYCFKDQSILFCGFMNHVKGKLVGKGPNDVHIREVPMYSSLVHSMDTNSCVTMHQGGFCMKIVSTISAINL